MRYSLLCHRGETQKNEYQPTPLPLEWAQEGDGQVRGLAGGNKQLNFHQAPPPRHTFINSLIPESHAYNTYNNNYLIRNLCTKRVV